MSQITITVKPKHLKGNDYMNSASIIHQMCPLGEAIREQCHKDYTHHVGIEYVFRTKSGEWGMTRWLYVPLYWNKSFVTDLINKANAGSEEEIQVTLTTYTNVIYN